MTFVDFKKLLKIKRGTIFSLVFIFVILTLLISLIGPLKYSSISKVLVMQKNISSSDSYTLSRSNEYLGNLFAEVIYSGTFFNSVMNSKYNVDKSYFSGDYGKQLEEWNKTVSTKTIADTGVIEISVYHPNSEQARLISLAINYILINDNGDYQGGDSVNISVLNQPVVSDYPDKPNLLYNVAFAFIISLFVSMVYIYLYPENRYNISLIPKRSNKGNRKKQRKIRGINDIKEIQTKNKTNEKIRIPVDKYNDRKEDNSKFESEDKVKEELFAKDVFEPQGDIKGLFK